MPVIGLIMPGGIPIDMPGRGNGKPPYPICCCAKPIGFGIGGNPAERNRWDARCKIEAILGHLLKTFSTELCKLSSADMSYLHSRTAAVEAGTVAVAVDAVEAGTVAVAVDKAAERSCRNPHSAAAVAAEDKGEVRPAHE